MSTTTGESQAGRRDPSAFFERLLPSSKLAVSMALAMLGMEGMDGWMMVYIPSDSKAPCEVMTSTHGWNLSMDPSRFTPPKAKRN